MLVELCVVNLGVIKEARLELGPGMNVLTGETGAGKTLVIDAIKLLAGARAEGFLVRDQELAARVDGRFDLSSRLVEELGESLEAFVDMTESGDDLEVVVSRQVPSVGRSKAWINAQMATSGQLRGLAPGLFDLQGQNEHMSLLTTKGQRDSLDRFGQIDLSRLNQLQTKIAQIRLEMAELGGDPDERLREIDFLTYQVDELGHAQLDNPGEEEKLELEEEDLAMATRRKEAVAKALMALGVVDFDTPGSAQVSASDCVSSAMVFLSGHAPFEDAQNLLTKVNDDLAEIGRLLRIALEGIQEDPERLAEVRARRQFLFDLARKYGGTLDDARNYYKNSLERLDSLRGYSERANRLSAELDQVTDEYSKECARIKQARLRSAKTLSAAVTKELADLSLPGARITIDVGTDGAGEDVVFNLSANQGEPAHPLAKVASGGELSRVALAVSLLTRVGPETLIFDEIDAGVGGQAAMSVGRALCELSKGGQVIVVTHLAQVAAFADRHFQVLKETVDSRTVTRVELLDEDARVAELSRMMSGQPDSKAAHLHARELVELANTYRK